LVRGSPEMREILKISMAMNKFLITEEFPLSAWFYEIVLTFPHMPHLTSSSGIMLSIISRLEPRLEHESIKLRSRSWS
jgi:hypothetical protein